MLKSSTDILGGGLIDYALGGDGLAIGQPVLMDYTNYQIIGYYTGYNSSDSKVGFVKNLDKKKIKGWISYDSKVPKAEQLIYLKDEHNILNLAGSSLEKEVKKIIKHSPVEVVVWPDIGYVGFWNGLSKDGSVKLDLGFDKRNEKYANIFNLAPIFGCESNPDLEYEAPNLNKVSEISILKTVKLNPNPVVLEEMF